MSNKTFKLFYWKNFVKIILKKAKKNYFELAILTIALLFLVVSLGYVNIIEKETNSLKESIQLFLEEKNLDEQNLIFVDIAGAVERPDVYQVSNGARLKDVLILAGGLSANADRLFFSRNFNLAQKLSDEQKIYIPTTWEDKKNLTNNTQQTENLLTTPINKSNLININKATAKELDLLPGIGPSTAQKIIDNRPYVDIDDLLSKKVLTKSQFEKIKNLITF